MLNGESAEPVEPCVGVFDDPSPPVASEPSTVFLMPALALLAVGHDEVDASPLQPLAQRVGVVGAICDHAPRLLSRSTFRAGGTLTSASMASISVASPGEALSGRTPNGRQSPSTSTIHFVPLPRLVLPTAEPPFSPERSCRPETPLPTTGAGLRRRVRPAAVTKRRATRPALPTGSTVASRSQERNTSRSETSTPLRSANTHRMPSRHGRLDAHGRPRLSMRRFGSSSNGPIDDHCASLSNWHRFFPMKEAHQTIRLLQKSPA